MAFGGHAGQLAELIEERETLKEVKKVIGFDVWRKYLNVEKHRWWDECSRLVKAYLVARACDTVRFGQAVADVTFPPPDILGATAKEVEDCTASLVGMVREKEKYREWHRNVPQLVVPEHLEPRVLSAGEKTQRDGTHISLGLSEQGIPLMTAGEIKQMRDDETIAFHRNLPP